MYRSTPSLAGSKSTLNSTTSGSRTTLNNTQYGSRSALNKTTTEKNCGLGTLKLVLVLINDNIEDTDLERKLKLDDFNHLTSDQMLKIVTFLMRTVIGEKQIHQPAVLQGFDGFGVGGITYDCGIDEIYHAIKPIFPVDSDLFHFSVLLMPSHDPKRTKGVITYIFSFVIMCDNFKEQFVEHHKQILDDIEEEKQLFGEVEGLRNAITEKIQEIAIETNRVPTLKREIQQIMDSIGHAQVELAKWNGQIETLTGKFQHEQKKIQRLNEKLQKIQMEIDDLQQYIVNDPNAIRVQNEAMQKQFQAESDKREALAEEIEKRGNERQAYEALNQRAKIAIQSLEAEVSRLVGIREKIDSVTKVDNDTAVTKTKIAQSKTNLDKLTIEFEKKSGELQRRTGEREKELNELAEEHNKEKEAIKYTKRQIKAVKKDISDAENAIDVVADQAEKLRQEIEAYVKMVVVTIPQMKNQHVAEAEEWVDRIAANFGNYPEL